MTMVSPANRVKDYRASPATVMVSPANRVKDYRARLANRFPAAGQWHPPQQLLWLVWS